MVHNNKSNNKNIILIKGIEENIAFLFSFVEVFPLLIILGICMKNKREREKTIRFALLVSKGPKIDSILLNRLRK